MSGPARPPHIDFSGLSGALRRQGNDPIQPERDASGARRPAQSCLTEVELISIEKRLDHRLRFGRIAAERIVNAETRIVSFRPNAIVAFVRWSANDYGTIHSRIDILRAVSAREAYTTVPFARPGGELLLSIQGSPKVLAALAAIELVEKGGVDPCDAAPDHWRHVHNRLSAGQVPRPYTAERHAAWLKRKAIEG